jgi:hypothetical protein
MIAIVKYQIATYSGEVNVPCDPDDDNDVIIAKAKRILRNRAGSFPFGYESWKVVDRYDND